MNDQPYTPNPAAAAAAAAADPKPCCCRHRHQTLLLLPLTQTRLLLPQAPPPACSTSPQRVWPPPPHPASPPGPRPTHMAPAESKTTIVCPVTSSRSAWHAADLMQALSSDSCCLSAESSNIKQVRLMTMAVKKAVADIWYTTRGTCSTAAGGRDGVTNQYPIMLQTHLHLEMFTWAWWG